MKIWEPKPPGTLWATPDLLRDCFTLFYKAVVCDVTSIKDTWCLFTKLFVPSVRGFELHHATTQCCCLVSV